MSELRSVWVFHGGRAVPANLLTSCWWKIPVEENEELSNRVARQTSLKRISTSIQQTAAGFFRATIEILGGAATWHQHRVDASFTSSLVSPIAPSTSFADLWSKIGSSLGVRSTAIASFGRCWS